MTKYTKDAPFVAEGVSVWRNSEGQVRYDYSRSNTAALAVAMHAFIEAEREGWHWINDDYTKARNGRWLASERWIAHDEFGDTWGWGSVLLPDSAANVHADFLAWKEAQDQPEEPTEPEPTPERSLKHVATIKLTLDTAGLADDLERVVAAIRGVLDPPEVDPLAHVKVGDSDPTPYFGSWCEADSDDDASACTREPGHPGQHISGNGSRVDAVWPQESAS